MILPDAPPGSAQVVRHYADLDRYYRELWGEHVHHGYWRTGAESPEEAADELVRHVADLAGIAGSERVVDVGSGYGATARWLTRERGARVTAVTLSPVQHEHAVELGGGPRYVLGDWLGNREPSSAYDVALALESTEHMASLERALAEVRRVLRPGGRFVACVWLSRERPSAWEVRHLLGPICAEGRLARLPTAPELRSTLTEQGLVVREMQDLSRNVARTWTICLRRAVKRLVADPGARRFLRDPAQPERVFARTLLRIRSAFATGSLRYGVVRADRT